MGVGVGTAVGTGVGTDVGVGVDIGAGVAVGTNGGVFVGTGVEGGVWALGVGLAAPMIVPISSPNRSMIALVSCGYCIRQGMTMLTCWGVTSRSPLSKALYCSLPKAV